MTPLTFWSLFAAAVVAVLAVAYGVGWGLTDCPRWFLPCQCRTDLPGPDLSMPAPGAGEHHWTDQDCPDDAPDGSCWDCQAPKNKPHQPWCPTQLDPDQAADQLIAEWHGHAPDCDGSLDAVLICQLCASQESARQSGTGDVWDQWWAGVDGLERECMLVHDWLVREERLWAELKAETREMCAA